MSVTAVPLQPVKTSFKVWLWVGVLAAVLLALGLAWMGTRSVIAARGTDEQYLAWNAHQPGVHTTESGLQYQVIEAGEGDTPEYGDMVTVSIEGTLRDGTVFQPRAGGPFPVQKPEPGKPGVIPGFTEALRLMRTGAHYKVWIPSKLAYDTVPPEYAPPELIHKLLIFDIEMSEHTTAAQLQQQQKMQQEMMRQQMEQQGVDPQSAPPQGAPPQGQ